MARPSPRDADMRAQSGMLPPYYEFHVGEWIAVAVALVVVWILICFLT
jgi:hypothetical protein